jgi:hypothetical protein
MEPLLAGLELPVAARATVDPLWWRHDATPLRTSCRAVAMIGMPSLEHEASSLSRKRKRPPGPPDSSRIAASSARASWTRFLAVMTRPATQPQRRAARRERSPERRPQTTGRARCPYGRTSYEARNSDTRQSLRADMPRMVLVAACFLPGAGDAKRHPPRSPLTGAATFSNRGTEAAAPCRKPSPPLLRR